MAKFCFFLVIILLPVLSRSQDSIRRINHEIGFNTVSLIKQLISNNPTNTLSTLPYDIFYNVYYKDKVGIRTGFGVSMSKSETEITGQTSPRQTTKNLFNYRIGVSCNFVQHKRITLNAFADYVGNNFKTETINTSTVQVFPNPVQKITNTTLETTKGAGGQIGIGVKYNIYHHLSLYAELPVTFLVENTLSEVTINDTGTITSSSEGTHSYETKVFIPTTLYLVLRF